jgi:hypothetical protein
MLNRQGARISRFEGASSSLNAGQETRIVNCTLDVPIQQVGR